LAGRFRSSASAIAMVGWVGVWVPCSRSSVSLGYPGATALLQEAGCGAEVYLDSGPGTGRARGEER